MSTPRITIQRSMPGVSLAVLVLGLALVTMRLVTGRSLGLKSFATQQVQSLASLIRSMLDSQHVRSYSQGEFTNVIFLHHSVGGNLVQQSNLREK